MGVSIRVLNLSDRFFMIASENRLMAHIALISSLHIGQVSKTARLVIAFFFLSCWTTIGFSQQMMLELKDGMLLGPGELNQIANVVPPQGKVLSGADVKALTIQVLDDSLRRTYMHRNRLAKEPFLVNQGQIKIELANKNLLALNAEPVPPGPIVSSPPFDLYGRRLCGVRSPNRLAWLVQGITEITPSYVRVQGIKSLDGACDWDMRLALSSFDSETLTKILSNNANQSNPNDWIGIVNLFEAAKRFDYARKNLEQAILKFNPALDSFKPVLTRLDQNIADQLFTASDLAVDAGQFQHSKLILESIQRAKLSIETQLKVAGKLDSLASGVKDRDELMVWITEDVSKVVDPSAKAEMQSLLPEISANLRPDTAVRFADYRRRRSDPTLKTEQLAALAISGWIYGSSAGKDNPSNVAAGIKARRLIVDYFSKPAREDQIVEAIVKLETLSPELVAKIVANMAPPLTTPESMGVKYRSDSVDSTQPPAESLIPGRFTIELPMGGELPGRVARYTVQLPPEYNPFRRYPCIFTLPGDLTNTDWQIAWWAGQYSPQSKQCTGEATKRGYIVVSPDWAEPKQPGYNYTENEHALVLKPLRDAIRRFSIDTDKVYLSGHFMGADAAWDIALAHPDLWAGCVVIGGEAKKFVKQYWENALYVPMYFVSGEYDAFNELSNGQEWDKLLSRWQIDCLVTLYRGRKPDHFQEELPRIMDWMSFPARVRNPFPVTKDLKKDIKFEVTTSRAGDKFFWWLEIKELSPEKLMHPLLYGKADTEYKIKSSINKDAEDGSVVSLPAVPAADFTIWLSPEFVNFDKPINIAIKGPSKRREPKPEIRVILEDVRSRADRQHPFWMRVDYSKAGN